MKRLAVVVPVLVLLASCALAQEKETPKYVPLAALGDNDPKGDACGEFFRVAKAKHAETIVFHVAGADKAVVLPITTLATVYVDKSTLTPQVNFLDLPGLPPEKSRMTRMLIAKDTLDRSPCLQKASNIIGVQDKE
jgi:hypothetical protein